MAVEKVRERGKEGRKRMRMREEETREGRRKERMQRKVTKEWRKERVKGRRRERGTRVAGFAENINRNSIRK